MDSQLMFEVVMGDARESMGNGDSTSRPDVHCETNKTAAF